ncbi:uncharacterized protein [Antedon mediterranea]|uniref:uncharacterized protein n=1 Tax=Antedon mediterranea TaxID=105859 RepID=UPI003AF6D122
MSSLPFSAVGKGGAVGIGIHNFTACGRGTVLANAIPSPASKSHNYDHHEQLAKPVCNCFRSTSQVICQTCGLMFHGRSRMICPQHPQVIHLMDADKCPKCHSNTLKEFISSPKAIESTTERWD